MSFPNGIALTPDESRLYVGHVEGISAVDVRTGKRIKLRVPSDAAVNSTDGLVWDGKDLLGIQPSPYLARVARIRLADDGVSIREVATMSSRPPPGLNLATGVVVNDQFYVAANVPDGLATPGQPQLRRISCGRACASAPQLTLIAYCNPPSGSDRSKRLPRLCTSHRRPRIEKDDVCHKPRGCAC